MTVAEFTRDRATFRCRHCDSLGQLEVRENPNNRGMQVHCPNCRKFDPIGGAAFLSKHGPKTGVVRSIRTESTQETWARWDCRCIGCGSRWDQLEALKIGRHQHHAPPLAIVGQEAETTLLPVCSLCHEHLSANQRAFQALLTAIADRLTVPTVPGDRIDEDPA